MGAKTRLKIGAHKFEIKIVDTQDDMGLCDTQNQKISLSPHQSREHMAVTLRHEVIHAILALAGIHPNTHEEYETIIDAIAYGWYAVDNENKMKIDGVVNKLLS